jgi:NAD-dependent SIR2 family protein deacetylase
MTVYAKGNHAVGQCQRCGEKKKLHELRDDGQTHLLVCASCYDIKHPAETPIRTDDAIALYRPAPDLDADASREIPAQFDMPLVDAEGWTPGSYFGGGT